MTNTEILCYVLGWQGGTLAQVAEVLDVSQDAILNASPDYMRTLCRMAQQYNRTTNRKA